GSAPVVPNLVGVRCLVASLVISLLVVLIPAAYCSPPDQNWIGGLYDGADYDDAVLAVTDAIGFPAIERTSILSVRARDTFVALLVLTRPDAPLCIGPVPRAPPLS